MKADVGWSHPACARFYSDWTRHDDSKITDKVSRHCSLLSVHQIGSFPKCLFKTFLEISQSVSPSLIRKIPKLYLFNFQHWLRLTVPHTTFHSFLPWIFHIKKIFGFSRITYFPGEDSIPKPLVYISKTNNNLCVQQEAARAERSIVLTLGGWPSS